jgi:mannosidase alpha-like ER degradation enhancer 1
VKQYRGRLLEMALDLGKRLLPAFNTVTGLPYARVNLRKGLDKGESVETCEDDSWQLDYRCSW